MPDIKMNIKIYFIIFFDWIAKQEEIATSLNITNS